MDAFLFPHNLIPPPSGKPFFDTLVDFMISGPIMAMVLSGAHAVTDWRMLIGPANSEKARVDDPSWYGFDISREALHRRKKEGEGN